MAYVYRHIRLDKNEPFYIGIGSDKNGKYIRANDINKRNKFWKNITNKTKYRVEILFNDLTWEEACEKEIEFISLYGRVDLNNGTLCNMTAGGGGCKDMVITQEHRDKLSKALKGKKGLFGKDNPFFGKKHTKESMIKKSETIIKKGISFKGENNPNFGKKHSLEYKQKLRELRLGKKHSKETIEKIKQWGKGRPKSQEWKDKVSGKNNCWYGKGYLMSGEQNNNAKKCILIETGKEYNCLKSACKELNLSYNTQRAYIKPNHKRHQKRKFNYI
jgi:hypothetical protein